jgi:hypothetical protein
MWNARVRSAIEPAFIWAAIGRAEILVSLADLPQQMAQVDQVSRNHVNALPFALHLPAAGQSAGRQHGSALPLKQEGPDNDIGMTCFVFDGREYPPAGTCGHLTNQYQTRHRQPGTVAGGKHIGAGGNLSAQKVLAHKGSTWRRRAESNAAIDKPCWRR